MTFLPTETVTFEVAALGGRDSFGDVAITYTHHTVSGCLVEPGSAREAREGLEVLQDRSITVHIPKTFTEDLNNSFATVRGRRYRTVSAPLAYTRTPVDWDRAITCEEVA